MKIYAMELPSVVSLHPLLPGRMFQWNQSHPLGSSSQTGLRVLEPGALHAVSSNDSLRRPSVSHYRVPVPYWAALQKGMMSTDISKLLLFNVLQKLATDGAKDPFITVTVTE